MADGNNEPSHNSEALLSDLNEAANHVDSTPQTCGPSPTVKAASLRLTRARRRLARKGSYSKEKPEETPTSRPQTRQHPRRQQPPKRPAVSIHQQLEPFVCRMPGRGDHRAHPATLPRLQGTTPAALRRLRSSGTSTREPRPPPVPPRPPCSSLMRAFEALLAFFGDAALIARL
ncbi:hypothetical protein MRX96_037598 [Rhipicephalus microplus]